MDENKTNPNDPIVPSTPKKVGENKWRIATKQNIDNPKFLVLKEVPGLTKREHMALQLLQGLLASGYKGNSYVGVANEALKYTDALIEELNQ